MKSKKLEQLNTVLFKLYDEQNKIEAELEQSWEENPSLEIKSSPDSDYMSEEIFTDENEHSKLLEIENKISIINNSIVNLEKNLFSEKNIDSINANFKTLEELKKQLSKLLNHRHQIKLIQSEVA
jgi:arylamine N-acetyltransferase